MVDNNLNEGASPGGETGSREPSPDSLGPTGFDPARLAAGLSGEMLYDLRNVAEGRPTVPGFGSPVWHLKCLGYVEERTIMKPCKACGTSLRDYSYDKITAAGREVLNAAIAIEAATAGETGTGSTEGEGAGRDGIAQPSGGDPQ